VTLLPARLYDGRTSAAVPVVVDLRDDPATGSLQLHLQGDTRHLQYDFARCRVDSDVGTGLRRVLLPDEAVVEIAQAADWDAMLARRTAAPRHGRMLGRAERRWTVALAALVLAAGLLWIAFQYGIPRLVDRGLRLVPAELDARIGAGGLALLDEQVFAPSRLSTERQRVLRAAFAGVAADLGYTGRVRLEFRRGLRVGANAFALPDGSVIVTDELVDVAAHDDELRAVFAHEIGHVSHRHAMRMLLAGSLSSLLTFAVLGDVSSATTLVAGIPATITHAAYSREYERDADRLARAWLESAHVPHGRLDDLLRRLAQRSGGGWTYLSTHPPLDERLHDAQS
jgi:hypothetical protein